MASTADTLQPESRFPDELVHAVNGKGVVVVVAVAVATLILANVLAFFTLERASWGMIRGKWEFLEAMRDPVDWLVLGDSSANHGVAPGELATHLGGTSVNLATVGHALLVNNVWMLDTYLERFGAPSNVVVVHTYDVWKREPLPAVFAQVPLREVRDNRDPQLYLSFRQNLDQYLFRLLPLYGARTKVERVIRDPEVLWGPKLKVTGDGFHPVDVARPAQVAGDVEGHRQRLSTSVFEISDANQRALDALIRMSDTYGIEVYIANAPVAEGLRSTPEFEAYFAGIAEMLIRLDEEHPRIHYVLRETPSFPHFEMETVDHVITPSAIDFSAQLAHSIERARPAVR